MNKHLTPTIDQIADDVRGAFALRRHQATAPFTHNTSTSRRKS